MEIKDYIHLYKQIPVRIMVEGYPVEGVLDRYQEKDNDNMPWRISFQKRSGGFDDIHKFSDHEIKPILRNLSDMTEEELKGCVASEWGTTHTFTDHYCKKKIAEISKSTYGLHNFLSMYGTTNSIPYLLSGGFDLFGLIDVGLAIDKKSIQ